ncbi:hypothetical protein C1752_10384 [Acaryochloris thomasi RCC1774]|uniref:ParB-like N-terminal domain-containing protein n=1 Tax=Acaryochloris thomasi RCC1774 TaxID=1764569 RepID=A0A2W1J8D4_9CYAN|nr:ParB/RepB/Spo0J family partition protein [Acaryochloris thomasi]PZD70663.1 hypothetical protein C1752_10384 [Acaryochloris thomasi RCC1774]
MPRRADLSKAKTRSSDPAVAKSILEQQTQDNIYIPLNKIASRPTGDTRGLNDGHISELVNSISVIGLITPLTIDKKHQLLAGAHRKAALHKLSQNSPKRYHELFPEGVPVRIMDIDSDIDTVNALQIEVEENTQRRNYTASEIKDAARKLEEAGYEKLRGRPAQGQKSLNRELMSVFRLSRRRITDILNEEKEEKISAQGCALINELRNYLKKTEKIYESIDPEASSKEIQRVEKDLGKLVISLKKAIKSEENRTD